MSDTATPIPDETLALQAAAGDRAAFDTLMTRHKEPLYRFIRRYVGQSDDAYDILQDGFIAAWTSLRRYDPKRRFAPWLYTIMLNKCRDFSRRQSVRRAFLRLLAVETSPTIMPQTDYQEAEDRTSARLAQLDAAIATLPPIYKEPLLLTMQQGHSQEEAAEILNTSRKAIEMRLYRARQKLAAKIEKDEEG